MLHDPRVRVVSFTGSTGVGRTLLKSAADQILTPAMELGGNAPLIVFDDADLDLAVKGTMLAKMRNLGEACTAANRIYVHEAVAEAFTEKLTAAMGALKVGNGLDEGVDVGPLVNASTRDKVAAFVEDAVAKGAKLRLGGKAPDGPGFFYPPTVMTDVPETAECVHDEIFGPVAALQTFTDQEDVIRRANATEYGLVAYVFSRDFKRALQVCERLDYGMVGLNRGLVSRPGGAVRRHQAVGPRPRGRARRHVRVHGSPVHLGGVVSMGEVIASPAVRAYAGRKGVDIEKLARETGRETIAREDVERKAGGGGTAPAPARRGRRAGLLGRRPRRLRPGRGGAAVALRPRRRREPRRGAGADPGRHPPRPRRHARRRGAARDGSRTRPRSAASG